MAPKWATKWSQNASKTGCPKNTENMNRNSAQHGLQDAPGKAKNRPKVLYCRRFLGFSPFSKMSTKRRNNGPPRGPKQRPKRLQNGPEEGSNRGPKRPSKTGLKKDPKRHPKMAPKGPKRAPNGPQEGPKMGPKRGPERVKKGVPNGSPKMAPKWAPRGPKMDQIGVSLMLALSVFLAW